MNNKKLCPVLNKTSRIKEYLEIGDWIGSLSTAKVLLMDCIVTLIWTVAWPIMVLYAIYMLCIYVKDIFKLKEEHTTCSVC